MRPVLFTWRGRAIRSHPAMLYLGLVFGLVVGNVVANSTGLDGGRVYWASVVLLPVANLSCTILKWPNMRCDARTDRPDGASSCEVSSASETGKWQGRLPARLSPQPLTVCLTGGSLGPP